MKTTFALMRQLALGLALFGSISVIAQPIIVGRSLALSGPLKPYGEAKRDGGDAYIEKINQAGGIAGKRISLVTLDDAYLPEKTVANLKEMAGQQTTTAFLGLFGVPPVAAALPVLAQLKIPAVGLTSGAAIVRTPHNPYAFPVRASYASEARKLASQIKTIGVSKVSAIYSDNAFGESLKENLQVALRTEGIEVQFFKIDVAAATAVNVVKAAVLGEPQAVFVLTLSQVAVPVLRELKKTTSRGFLYTFSPVDTTVVLKELGAGASGLGITQIVPIPSGVRVPVVVEYLDALKALGRGTPSFYGLEAYIEAKVLVEGLKRAGGSAAPANLVKALETMKAYDAGGYTVSYAPGAHTGSTFVEIDIIDSAGVVRR
jgi:branched-chain amino acid transport system substrate-binding protein